MGQFMSFQKQLSTDMQRKTSEAIETDGRERKETCHKRRFRCPHTYCEPNIEGLTVSSGVVDKNALRLKEQWHARFSFSFVFFRFLFFGPFFLSPLRLIDTVVSLLLRL